MQPRAVFAKGPDRSGATWVAIGQQALDAVSPRGDTGAAKLPFHSALRAASTPVPHVEVTPLLLQNP